jgi:hypothetical protein
MEKVRIHSEGFRNLFYLYHLSGCVGFIMLLLYVFLFAFGNISHNLLLACGVLMIAIPLTTAPPEIIVLLKERRIIFRCRLKSMEADFDDIHKITTCGNAIEISDCRNDVMIVIRQEQFKNIPLQELGNYLSELISGNTDINRVQYTSIWFGRCKVVG